MTLKINRRFFFTLLIIITVLGFLLRLQVCRELAVNDKQVTSPSVYTDMYTYKLYSEQIIKGEYNRDFYYQPLYYAVFLPFIKQLFGTGVWPVIIVQCLLSALTIWFAAISSAMLGGRRAGLLTGLLLAGLSIIILYVPYHLIATLQAFWVSLIVFLVLKELDFAKKHCQAWIGTSCIHWGVIGFVVSLAILTRGNIWFFIPGIVIAWAMITFNRRSEEKKSFKKIALKSLPMAVFIVMIILPQIPFAWKNTQLKGRLCGPSTAAGAVLSLGNTPESPPGGRDAGTGPGPMEYPETCLVWNATAEQVSIPHRIWGWFCREPLAFCELQWRKLLLFWDRREIPNNIAVEYQGLKSVTWLLSGLIPIGSVNTPQGKMTFIANNIIPSTIGLLVLSFAGILFLLAKGIGASFGDDGIKTFVKNLFNQIRSHLGAYLVLYFIIAYWLGTAAFYILARFRVPVYPMLGIFAGAYIDRLLVAVAGKKRIIGVLFWLLPSFIIVCYGYDLYRYRLESKIMRFARPNGVVSPLDNDLLILDNGPFSFGSWQPIELKENMPITKKFSIPENSGDFKKARIMIDLLWEVPGSAVIEINGKNYILKEPNPIKKAYEFELPPGHIMDVTLVPRKMDCRIFAICDMQRNYQRSAVAGKNPGGELVCKLNLSK